MGEQLTPPAQHITLHTGSASGRLFRALPRLLKETSIEWMKDNVPRLGASVAFYALLSLAPFLIVALAVAAIVYGQAAAQGRLALEIESIGGPDLARTIQEVIRGAYQPRTGVIATFLGVATLAFGATSMFVELRDAMNTIWGVPLPNDRNNAAAIMRLIRDRFFWFARVTCIGFLLLIALVLNAWIAAARIAVPPVATFVASYLVVMVLFAALYKLLPDVALEWRDVAIGALITSLLFMLGKHLMGLYFANTNFRSTYGAAGSPIVILLWVYYSAQLYFWGAEFSKVYTKNLGSHSDRQH